jgi:hypothetical protein
MNSELAKRRQFHQIIFGHGLQMPPRFAPSRESSHNHKRVEAFFPQ